MEDLKSKLSGKVHEQATGLLRGLTQKADEAVKSATGLDIEVSGALGLKGSEDKKKKKKHKKKTSDHKTTGSDEGSDHGSDDVFVEEDYETVCVEIGRIVPDGSTLTLEIGDRSGLHILKFSGDDVPDNFTQHLKQELSNICCDQELLHDCEFTEHHVEGCDTFVVVAQGAPEYIKDLSKLKSQKFKSQGCRLTDVQSFCLSLTSNADGAPGAAHDGQKGHGADAGTEDVNQIAVVSLEQRVASLEKREGQVKAMEEHFRHLAVANQVLTFENSKLKTVQASVPCMDPTGQAKMNLPMHIQRQALGQPGVIPPDPAPGKAMEDCMPRGELEVTVPIAEVNATAQSLGSDGNQFRQPNVAGSIADVASMSSTGDYQEILENLRMTVSRVEELENMQVPLSRSVSQGSYDLLKQEFQEAQRTQAALLVRVAQLEAGPLSGRGNEKKLAQEHVEKIEGFRQDDALSKQLLPDSPPYDSVATQELITDVPPAPAQTTSAYEGPMPSTATATSQSNGFVASPPPTVAPTAPIAPTTMALRQTDTMPSPNVSTMEPRTQELKIDVPPALAQTTSAYHVPMLSTATATSQSNGFVASPPPTIAPTEPIAPTTMALRQTDTMPSPRTQELIIDVPPAPAQTASAYYVPMPSTATATSQSNGFVASPPPTVAPTAPIAPTTMALRQTDTMPSPNVSTMELRTQELIIDVPPAPAQTTSAYYVPMPSTATATSQSKGFVASPPPTATVPREALVTPYTDPFAHYSVVKGGVSTTGSPTCSSHGAQPTAGGPYKPRIVPTSHQTGWKPTTQQVRAHANPPTTVECTIRELDRSRVRYRSVDIPRSPADSAILALHSRPLSTTGSDCESPAMQFSGSITQTPGVMQSASISAPTEMPQSPLGSTRQYSAPRHPVPACKTAQL